MDFTIPDLIVLFYPFIIAGLIFLTAAVLIIRRFVKSGTRFNKDPELTEKEGFLKEKILQERFGLKWTRRLAWLLMIGGVVILVHFARTGGPNKGQVLIVHNNHYFELQAGFALLAIGLIIAELTTQIIKRTNHMQKNVHEDHKNQPIYPNPTR